MRDPAGRAVLDGLSACYGFEKSQKDGQPKYAIAWLVM